jgi:purine-binding chemotaxis protein CheW
VSAPRRSCSTSWRCVRSCPTPDRPAVPTAPSFVEGIIIVRNEVIPIIDLRDRLYGKSVAAPEQSQILITRSTAGVIGLKVDSVRRIVNVDSDALLPPPPLVRGVRAELLIAVVPHGEEVYLLIDMEALLTADEKVELSDAHLEATPVT